MIANNLRLNIEALSFPKAAANVTASLGITIFRKEDNAERLLNRVDCALYKAKGRGRNIVVEV